MAGDMTAIRGRKSRAEELADAIARDIYHGVLPPDSVLAGVRDVARQYRVSHPTVLAAYDILEKQNLIVRQERRRIQIKARNAAADVREILYFSLGRHERKSFLSRAIYQFIEDSEYAGQYDFFTRIVGSPDLSTAHTQLGRELSRIEKLGFLDCAVIHGGGLTPPDIEQCLKLPFPVVFLGDLEYGVPANAHIWQIRPDSTAVMRATLRYAAMRNYTSIVLFHNQDMADIGWVREALAWLEKHAAALHLNLQLIAAPGDTPAVWKQLSHTAGAIAADAPTAAMLFAAFNLEWPDFGENRLWQIGRFPHIGLLKLAPAPEYRKICYMQHDFAPLHRELQTMLAAAGQSCSHSRLVRAAVPSRVVEANFVDEETWLEK